MQQEAGVRTVPRVPTATAAAVNCSWETILLAGVYRLVFDTASYFSALKIDSLYPVVEITFQVRDGESHFHIPLLLSANGYTTYRGT